MLFFKLLKGQFSKNLKIIKCNIELALIVLYKKDK